MKKNTVFGLQENWAAALSYFFIPALVFLVMEKENKFVRFHSLQAVLFTLAVGVIKFVAGILTIVPILGGLAFWAVGTLLTLVWIFLVYMAYKGTSFKIPVLGDVAWEQVNK